MYDFLRIQYELGHITAEQVRGYVPRWLTQAQAEDITGVHHIVATDSGTVGGGTTERPGSGV